MSMIINKELPNPAALKAEFPVPEHIKEIKAARDKEIAAVFRGESDKFLVIVGPCSADNEESVCDPPSCPCERAGERPPHSHSTHLHQ